MKYYSYHIQTLLQYMQHNNLKMCKKIYHDEMHKNFYFSKHYLAFTSFSLYSATTFTAKYANWRYLIVRVVNILQNLSISSDKQHYKFDVLWTTQIHFSFPFEDSISKDHCTLEHVEGCRTVHRAQLSLILPLNKTAFNFALSTVVCHLRRWQLSKTLGWVLLCWHQNPVKLDLFPSKAYCTCFILDTTNSLYFNYSCSLGSYEAV